MPAAALEHHPEIASVNSHVVLSWTLTGHIFRSQQPNLIMAHSFKHDPGVPGSQETAASGKSRLRRQHCCITVSYPSICLGLKDDHIGIETHVAPLLNVHTLSCDISLPMDSREAL
jgi:hypothetical protein